MLWKMCSFIKLSLLTLIRSIAYMVRPLSHTEFFLTRFVRKSEYAGENLRIAPVRKMPFCESKPHWAARNPYLQRTVLMTDIGRNALSLAPYARTTYFWFQKHRHKYINYFFGFILFIMKHLMIDIGEFNLILQGLVEGFRFLCLSLHPIIE